MKIWQGIMILILTTKLYSHKFSCIMMSSIFDSPAQHGCSLKRAVNTLQIEMNWGVPIQSSYRKNPATSCKCICF